jgi:hypothetical protein
MPTPTPDVYLAGFPPRTQALAQRLRAIVKRALPAATEQVKLGWQLIGLYVPGPARPVYLGFIIPHADYVTLGFEYGLLLDDPDGRLLGGAEKLKQVRYLSFRSDKEIRASVLVPFIKQAADLALMPPALRTQMLHAARSGR